MKKLLCALAACTMLCGCTAAPAQTNPAQTTLPPESVSTGDFETKWADSGFVRIALDDAMPAVTLPEGMDENAVTIANDIIYYEEGHDESYGEGEKGEAHSAEEAARHTVVHINAPGTYVLTGKLSAGQIAVDLGEDAENDPAAVVNLILDGVDITNTVAPAVIFYNVYECGDTDSPSATVDTSAAGANVILAEGSRNYVNGSHVAKIYKPGTDKKLHKYDAAFYSKMSMNVDGEGELHITADNEGLDSELHLTVGGGTINIASGNDGINTNEDGVSVTTVNGGHLRIHVTGETGEGDGIDSNGWLVINGGIVEAMACPASMDSGIDSDMGIHINGGTVIATGNMLDRIEDGSQTHAVFTFASRQQPGTYTLKNAAGETVLEVAAENAFQNLILSSPELTGGTYTLWSGSIQFQGVAGSSGGFFGEMQPIDRPERPGGGGDVEIPPQPTQPIVTHGDQPAPDMSVQGQPPAIPEMPEDMPVPQFPEGSEGQMPNAQFPEGGEGNMPMPQLPEGVEPPQDGFGRQPIGNVQIVGTLSTDFPLTSGANYFTNVRPVE